MWPPVLLVPQNNGESFGDSHLHFCEKLPLFLLFRPSPFLPVSSSGLDSEWMLNPVLWKTCIVSLKGSSPKRETQVLWTILSSAALFSTWLPTIFPFLVQAKFLRVIAIRDRCFATYFALHVVPSKTPGVMFIWMADGATDPGAWCRPWFSENTFGETTNHLCWIRPKFHRLLHQTHDCHNNLQVTRAEQIHVLITWLKTHSLDES